MRIWTVTLVLGVCGVGCLSDDDGIATSEVTCGAADSWTATCSPLSAEALDTLRGTWRLRAAFTGGTSGCTLIGLGESEVDRFTLGPGPAFSYVRYSSVAPGVVDLDTLTGTAYLDTAAYGASPQAPALVGEYLVRGADTVAATVLLFDRACETHVGAVAGDIDDGPARYYIRND